MPPGVYKHKSRLLMDRFWEKVIKGSPEDCWNWTAFKTPFGHGQMYTPNGAEFAHRIAYAHFVGEIPDGLFVLHHCDNPACVNPNHLFLGTQTDNMRDMVQKGRQIKGERVGSAKLTKAAVLEIRKTSEPHAVVAERYGIHKDHIGRIKRRQRWGHVADIDVPTDQG